jgi:hypothetical protein
MISTMSTPIAKRPMATMADEFSAEYRQRRAFEESQRAEQRRADEADQRSDLNSADLRIRAWEKVHHLRMPADPRHPALGVIAQATQLSLAAVLNEQLLRSARRASAGV